MAYTTINKSTLHFNTKLYVADQQDNRTITGVGFQPDWVWLRNRDQAVNHQLYDAVRGALKSWATNSTAAEATETDTLKAFASDGFTLGTGWGNQSTGDDYVSWNWKANGIGSSNTDGTINSTYTSANTTSGFSIVTYTGTGSSATVGHGLGTTPSMVWIFNRTDGGNAHVFHKALGSTQYLLHASTLAAQTYAPVGIGSLTSTTFSVGTVSGVNGSSKNYVAYVFAEKQGFSKVDSYTGNGSTDGTFVYTGFRPALIMAKNKDAADHWVIFDTKRGSYNQVINPLFPNLNNTAGSSTSYAVDIVSNGFKLRGTDGATNSSGNVYIYMAFAEAPLVGSNNVPCTAR